MINQVELIEFLQACIAHPLDVQRRLVLSDWLEDQGFKNRLALEGLRQEDATLEICRAGLLFNFSLQQALETLYGQQHGSVGEITIGTGYDSEGDTICFPEFGPLPACLCMPVPPAGTMKYFTDTWKCDWCCTIGVQRWSKPIRRVQLKIPPEVDPHSVDYYVGRIVSEESGYAAPNFYGTGKICQLDPDNRRVLVDFPVED